MTLVLSQLLSNIYLVMIIKYLLDKKLEFLKYPQIFLRWNIRQIRLYLRTDRQTVKICTRCHFREFIDYPAIHCCSSCAFHTKKTPIYAKRNVTRIPSLDDTYRGSIIQNLIWASINIYRQHIKIIQKFPETKKTLHQLPNTEKSTRLVWSAGNSQSQWLHHLPVAIYCISCCCW